MQQKQGIQLCYGWSCILVFYVLPRHTNIMTWWLL